MDSQSSLRISHRNISKSISEFLPAVSDQIKSILKAKAVIPPQIPDIKRAGFLLELGRQRLKAGDVDDAVTLAPIYLRRPPIGALKKE